MIQADEKAQMAEDLAIHLVRTARWDLPPGTDYDGAVRHFAEKFCEWEEDVPGDILTMVVAHVGAFLRCVDWETREVRRP